MGGKQMLNLRKLMGLGSAQDAPQAPSRGAVSYSPYRLPEINTLYNMLFCDDAALFAARSGQSPAPWQEALLAEPGSPEKIRAIAENAAEESRVRLLAYNWLRQHDQPVPRQQLLGVIIEVPLDGGLDVLAAYTDARVRYINQTGKLSLFDGGPQDVVASASKLLGSASAIVKKIGPWEKERLPPPRKGSNRFSFLVSDGLYFGEGTLATLQKDPMAAPLLAHATELLQVIVNTNTKQ